MGSFAITCCLSDMPIEVGDEVRWFMLTENPYDDNLVCYPHGLWVPRTWPVRAQYNDYGSIENYDGKSPAVLSTIEGLKEDMVEVGTGDNQCHDVPTRKGMSFEETLNAVWEKRIVVAREYDTFKKFDEYYEKNGLPSREKHIPPKPEFVPTLQRVSETLEEAGFPVANKATDQSDDNEFLVDEIEPGWVRVRTGGYKHGWDSNRLQEVLPVLQAKYAAMISVGSGSYSNWAEIQVMPLPMTKDNYGPDNHFSFRYEKSKRPLYLYQAMISEKVWNAAIEFNQAVSAYRENIQKMWESRIADDEHPLWSDLYNYEYRDSLATGLAIKSAIPFSMGLAEHFNLIAKLHKKTPFTDKQINDFLDDIVGFACIHELTYANRYWWRPSFSCGPQFGEYKIHTQWHRALAEVSAELEQKWDDEDEDWEDDEE